MEKKQIDMRPAVYSFNTNNDQISKSAVVQKFSEAGYKYSGETVHKYDRVTLHFERTNEIKRPVQKPAISQPWQ